MIKLQRYELTEHNSLKECDTGPWAAARIEELERENAILRQERDKARKALEPFAQFSDAYDVDHVRKSGGTPKNYDLSDSVTVLTAGRYGTDTARVVTVCDFRRAAAIRNMGGGENES